MIYTFNLRRVLEKPRTKRARVASHLLKQLVARHTKTEINNVFLDEKISSFLWSSSMGAPPRKIRVKVMKDEKGAHVSLIEEKKEEKKEAKKEEKKEERKEEEKKETMKEEKKEEKKKEKKEEKNEEKEKEVK